MENIYSIGVNNRYEALLDDETDPLELLRVHEQEQELRKKTKVKDKENKIKPGPVALKTPEKTRVQNLQENDRHSNSDRERSVRFVGDTNDVRNKRPDKNEAINERAVKQDKFERPARRDRENVAKREFANEFPNNNGERREFFPKREFTNSNGRREFLEPKGDGGHSRGGYESGRGRGSYQSSGDHGGRRNYDRQVSYKKPINRGVGVRNGGGAHNWGTHKDDGKNWQDEQEALWDDNGRIAEVAEDNTVTANDEYRLKSDDPWLTNVVEAPAAEPIVEQTDEPVEITLDEWKALKRTRQKPEYNLRKAGEGEDQSAWRKMFPIEKKWGEPTLTSDDDLVYDPADYPQKVGRRRFCTDIEVRFNDGRRGFGGRRGRGRGGRGGGRSYITEARDDEQEHGNFKPEFQLVGEGVYEDIWKALK